ncbi:type VI secretion system ImpA family N-terminal domain-containing protein [Escherichia coli]
MTSEVKLKTGGDPRSLPDYAALRDEISKLTHPARPDVDWRYVETLCPDESPNDFGKNH